MFTFLTQQILLVGIRSIVDLAILHANVTAEYKKEICGIFEFQYCFKTSRYKANVTKAEIIKGLITLKAKATKTAVANIGINTE